MAYGSVEAELLCGEEDTETRLDDVAADCRLEEEETKAKEEIAKATPKINTIVQREDTYDTPGEQKNAAIVVKKY